jgi:CRISPR-associated protein Cas1
MTTNLRVHSLHALTYCERLFYLENVENLRVADERVFAGRRLHVEIERDEDEGEWMTLALESAKWGLTGKVDCVRRRDGRIIPYEHKRGRSARNLEGKPDAWWSDRLQLIAYAALLEEHTGQTIAEGRIRYHADNTTVRVDIDDDAWLALSLAIARARELQASVVRPPVTSNEKLCEKCSLAPVCLPEEARLGDRATERQGDRATEGQGDGERNRPIPFSPYPSAAPSPRPPVAQLTGRKPLRLFPADDDRQALHVLTQGARVSRKGDRLEISPPYGSNDQPSLHPVNEVGQVVLHGFAQITTQALRLCADKEIAVHWLTGGGRYLGAWSAGAGSVQRRIRQYKALTDDDFCLKLSKRLVEARVRGQLSFLLRASREAGRGSTEQVAESIASIRKLMGPMSRAANIHSLRGYEGSAGAQYFKALPQLIVEEAGESMKPNGRNRRPPRDRCNAMLSFGYAMLMRDVLNAILVVGLDPNLGFYHQPLSQAHPLALDLMEMFRVPLVDLPVVASINRKQWDEDEHFRIAGQQVWLSDSGKKKLIAIYERRKSDQWKHPVIGYSLSYSRLMELEVRLLEKEWMNEGGLFARFRSR